MRWLGGIGGAKCGGGWYDWLGTTEKTYLEQARMTILGGARESMLFCYGGLQGTTGPKNGEALRLQIPRVVAHARGAPKRKSIGPAAADPAAARHRARGHQTQVHRPGRLPAPQQRSWQGTARVRLRRHAGPALVPCHEFP